MKNIAIIGSGSWGVALAIHLAKLGNNIKIWSFAEDERDLINKEKSANSYQMLHCLMELKQQILMNMQ